VPASDRRPRYGRFLVTGGLSGLLLSIALLAVFGAVEGGRDRTELAVLLSVFLVGLGVLLGGAFAVFSEGRSQPARRAPADAGETAPSP
jgi:hypothetical protein